MGTEAEDFLSWMLPRMIEADDALHNGDAEPRKAIWSHNDPVSLFGAVLSNVGWNGVERAFDALAGQFSGLSASEMEVLAAGASGDLAYILAIEHTTASVGGRPPQAYKLRVTTICRREEGEWKVVHRHADPVPGSEGAIVQVGHLSEALDRPH